MNQQIERRLIKVDVDAIIAEAQKKKEREDKCVYHLDANGEIKQWLRCGCNFCFYCGAKLREIKE
jgi:hypothetical protein